jgi:F-type H+-transporting ATPase subunit delta
MSEITIAQRYAQPFLELALEQGIAGDINRDMELLRDSCNASHELKAVLSNPVIRGYKKLAILKAIFSKEVHPLTLTFFDVIDRRNREEVLYTVSSEFIRLYKEHKGIAQVTVITAVALNDSSRQELINKLTKELGKEIELTEQVDNTLIGGLMIKMGNSLVDNSIRTGLKRLQMNFSNSI